MAHESCAIGACYERAQHHGDMPLVPDVVFPRTKRLSPTSTLSANSRLARLVHGHQVAAKLDQGRLHIES